MTRLKSRSGTGDDGYQRGQPSHLDTPPISPADSAYFEGEVTIPCQRTPSTQHRQVRAEHIPPTYQAVPHRNLPFCRSETRPYQANGLTAPETHSYNVEERVPLRVQPVSDPVRAAAPRGYRHVEPPTFRYVHPDPRYRSSGRAPAGPSAKAVSDSSSSDSGDHGSRGAAHHLRDADQEQRPNASQSAQSQNGEDARPHRSTRRLYYYDIGQPSLLARPPPMYEVRKPNERFRRCEESRSPLQRQKGKGRTDEINPSRSRPQQASREAARAEIPPPTSPSRSQAHGQKPRNVSSFRFQPTDKKRRATSPWPKTPKASHHPQSPSHYRTEERRSKSPSPFQRSTYDPDFHTKYHAEEHRARFTPPSSPPSSRSLLSYRIEETRPRFSTPNRSHPRPEARPTYRTEERRPRSPASPQSTPAPTHNKTRSSRHRFSTPTPFRRTETHQPYRTEERRPKSPLLSSSSRSSYPETRPDYRTQKRTPQRPPASSAPRPESHTKYQTEERRPKLQTSSTPQPPPSGSCSPPPPFFPPPELGKPRNLYTALNLPTPSPTNPISAPQIKAAYRRLALRYHPDRCKEEGAEEKFKEVQGAWEVLGDGDRRREYDFKGGFQGKRRKG